MIESRRKALRLPYHNYTQPGAYFIIVCADERRCLFGDVIEGVMMPNDLGQEVAAVWTGLPGRCHGLTLDQFVVMPNHVHGILFLAEGASSISDIVGVFKGLSAHRINQQRNTQGSAVWQRGFYDHVIRDDSDLTRIREYIEANPARWALDEENPVRARGNTAGRAEARPYESQSTNSAEDERSPA